MTEDNQDALVGKCFLSLNSDGKADRQGIVRAKVCDRNYVIQFFDWIMGEPSTIAVVPIESLMSSSPSDKRKAHSVILFEDSEHLRFWMENRAGQHLNKQ